MTGYFTYDTSVIISRGMSELPDRFLWSSVVHIELAARAKDESQRKQLDRLFNAYAKDNSLIYPQVEDWQLAGKILYWLTQKRRKTDGGKLVKLRSGISQHMAMDVLLAVSARRWDAMIVVDN